MSREMVQTENMLRFSMAGTEYIIDSPEQLEEKIKEAPQALHASRNLIPGTSEISLYGRLVGKDGIGFDGHIVLDEPAAQNANLGINVANALKRQSEEEASLLAVETNPVRRDILNIRDNKTGIEYLVYYSARRGIIDVANYAGGVPFTQNFNLLPPPYDSIDTADSLESFLRIFNHIGNTVRSLIPSQRESPSVIEIGNSVAIQQLSELALRDVALQTSKEHKEYKQSAFNTICGLSAEKERLQELVIGYKDSDTFKRWGVKPPQAALLYGPPGTGKTMLGTALADELGAELHIIKSTDIVDKYIGVSGKNLETIFKDAIAADHPVVIFFDEFDSLINSNSRSGSAADQEHNQVAGLFKTRMNILKDTPHVFVIAATNKSPHDLDKSLIRSGRFEMQIYIPLPSTEARAEIITNLSFPDIAMGIDKPLFASDTLNIPELADITEGLSGADITTIFNGIRMRKAMHEIRTGEPQSITQDDIKNAINHHNRQ